MYDDWPNNLHCWTAYYSKDPPGPEECEVVTESVRCSSRATTPCYCLSVFAVPVVASSDICWNKKKFHSKIIPNPINSRRNRTKVLSGVIPRYRAHRAKALRVIKLIMKWEEKYFPVLHESVNLSPLIFSFIYNIFITLQLYSQEVGLDL